MSDRKLETFLDMMPGDVVTLRPYDDRSWLFWMSQAGDVFSDIGSGILFTNAPQNHWLDSQRHDLTLLEEGIETVKDLREWGVAGMSTTIAIDIKAATDARLQEALERIHKELRIRAFSMASMEPSKQYVEGVITESTRIVSVPARIGKGASTAVASAFVEPLPLTEEAGYLEGMDRYLSPEWDIPTCPIIGKGPSDHCKHGMGNLDYCPHCEDMDLSEEEI